MIAAFCTTASMCWSGRGQGGERAQARGTPAHLVRWPSTAGFVPHLSPTVPPFWDHSGPLLPLKEIFASGQKLTVNHHVRGSSPRRGAAGTGWHVTEVQRFALPLGEAFIRVGRDHQSLLNARASP